MLDMIAMEMAAPDTDAAYEAKLDDAEVDESQIHANQMDDPARTSHKYPSRPTRYDVTFPDSSDANDAPASASHVANGNPASTRAGTGALWTFSLRLSPRRRSVRA